MPPWKADAADGPFVGQHPLTPDEISLIRRWVDGGAVEGDVKDRPPPPRVAAGWQLGAPDLIATLDQSFALPPDGTDVFRIFVMPLPVSVARYVKGVEFLPGNARVVHHANIRVDRTAASRRYDEADPAPGYDGLIAHSATYPDGFFLGWTPGQVSPLLPKGLAWRLERGTDLGGRGAHAAERKARGRAPFSRAVLRRRAARTDAIDASSRTAEHRHSGRRQPLRHRRFVCAAGRGRGAGRAAARALPRPLGARHGDAARRHDAIAHSHSGLGFSLAARLSLRDAVRAAEGHHDRDPLHLRQLRCEPAQSGDPATTRVLGTTIIGRDGRRLDSALDSDRCGSRDAQSPARAQGHGRGRHWVRAGHRVRAVERGAARRCGDVVSAPRPVERGGSALRAIGRAQSRRARDPFQPGHGADRCGAPGRGRSAVPSRRCACGPTTRRRTTTWAAFCCSAGNWPKRCRTLRRPGGSTRRMPRR